MRVGYAPRTYSASSLIDRMRARLLARSSASLVLGETFTAARTRFKVMSEGAQRLSSSVLCISFRASLRASAAAPGLLANARTAASDADVAAYQSARTRDFWAVGSFSVFKRSISLGT